MNWMSVVGLCLIVLGTIFSFLGTYLSDKKSQEELTSKIQEKNVTIDDINSNNIKLIDQNTSLLASTNDVSNTNKDLLSKNTSMLSKIEKYQDAIEERNRRIQSLEVTVNNVREYGYYANLDMSGTSISYGNGLIYTSELSDMMAKVLFSKEGKIHVKYDKTNLKVLDEVIEKHPNFPFAYYAKSDILKHFRDAEWITFAKKAKSIFEITTSIKGHNLMHDQALAILVDELKDIE